MAHGRESRSTLQHSKAKCSSARTLAFTGLVAVSLIPLAARAQPAEALDQRYRAAVGLGASAERFQAQNATLASRGR